ncbi:MAG: hypothetical protein KatS3mg009_1974 [Acidimicrobiia bacterium]|nr:MAG: hypothetical protein KatS3mg009_1974 [Acidimicrobiia bacterium]
MANKEVNEIIKKLIRQGWRVERGAKHWKAYPPDKSKRMITIPTTPSDHRSLKNVISDLRRAGADL